MQIAIRSFKQVLAFVNRVRDIDSNVDIDKFTLEDVEANAVRCPDQEAADKMFDAINEVSYLKIVITGFHP